MSKMLYKTSSATVVGPNTIKDGSKFFDFIIVEDDKVAPNGWHKTTPDAAKKKPAKSKGKSDE